MLQTWRDWCCNRLLRPLIRDIVNTVAICIACGIRSPPWHHFSRSLATPPRQEGLLHGSAAVRLSLLQCIGS